MQNLKKYFPAVFLAICVVAVSFFIYKSFFEKPSAKLPSQTKTNVREIVSTKYVFPTRTSEEIKIISEAKTATIDITGTKVEPPVLEVNAYDQVQFNNKSGKTIKVVGEKWGNFPVPSGLNMTQPFNEAGSYKYKIEGLDTVLTGEIVVK